MPTEETPRQKKQASRATRSARMSLRSNRSLRTISRNFGCVTPQELRPIARTESTRGSTRHSSRTPAPTIPVAPKRMIFTKSRFPASCLVAAPEEIGADHRTTRRTTIGPGGSARCGGAVLRLEEIGDVPYGVHRDCLRPGHRRDCCHYGVFVGAILVHYRHTAVAARRNVDQLLVGIPAERVDTGAVGDLRHHFPVRWIHHHGSLSAAREDPAVGAVECDAGGPVARIQRPG